MVRLRWKLVGLFAALLVLAVPVTGCGDGDAKVLTMYVAYGGPEIIAEEFEKATGIKIQYLTMSSGEVLTRLRAEKSNPQTDIWFGGGADAFLQAAEEGLIQAYKSPNRGNVDAAFRDQDGYWTGVSLVVVGLLVNTNRLTDKGLTMPATWADLADEAYHDEIIAPDPRTSGTSYAMVSGILQIMGEEAGWALLDDIYANVPFVEKSGAAPPQKTLAGEFAIAVVPDPHNTLIHNPGAPVASVFNEDGVLAWPSPVAIVKGARNLDNAKAFVDWCLSPEGQTVLMAASPRVPTTDVDTVTGVPQLGDLNMADYDYLFWGGERERVIAEWEARYPQYE